MPALKIVNPASYETVTITCAPSLYLDFRVATPDEDDWTQPIVVNEQRGSIIRAVCI